MSAESSQEAPARSRQRGHGPGRPFVKGQPSPNPGGRPRGVGEVSAAARKHTTAAIRTLVAMLRSPKDAVRVAAAEALLDRGWGRAPQAIRVDLEQHLNLAEVTEAEWHALATLRHQVRPELPAAAQIVEAEVLPAGPSLEPAGVAVCERADTVASAVEGTAAGHNGPGATAGGRAAA